MEQINIRVDSDEKEIIKTIAGIKGMSVVELVKRMALENIKKDRVDLAFKLQKEGKLSRKGTLKMSGLSGSEFLVEWANRGAIEELPEGIMESMRKRLKDISFK